MAESEASCVVFGMPAELIAKNGATTILAADKVTERILTWAR
ncbi:MAG: hypothetical protein QX193_03635 [Methylococcales bacterium]